MLQTTAICSRVRCGITFDRSNANQKHCSRKCQIPAKNVLSPHQKVISTVEELNKLGTGMASVRFGITHPKSEVVRWFPGMRPDLHRPAFPIPMINLPYNLLPGSGLYHLAFYDADQKLASRPEVRLSVNMTGSAGAILPRYNVATQGSASIGRCVRCSLDGVLTDAETLG